MTEACFLNELGVVCALGAGKAEVAARMFAGESGVALTEQYSPGRAVPLGAVSVALPAIDRWPLRVRSRNNQLALAAAEEIRPAIANAASRYGADRVAVVVGTSTSGIGESERAFVSRSRTGLLPTEFHFAQQEIASLAQFLALALDLRGLTVVHASACASSAKAMAGAARLLRQGLADAVLTGGVDSLCAFTLAGFASLELVSSRRCNPLSANRDGINIGEGAALFLMTRDPATMRLRSWGESSDGHHFSAPDPRGVGARQAMEEAMRRAAVASADIDYVNLHGTATPQNDAMESAVVHGLFGDRVPVSSTKPLTGHALGAAGAIEAALCWLAMQDSNVAGRLPPHSWDGSTDRSLPPLHVTAVGEQLGRPIRRALSNSFAFGGANAVLLLERE